MSKLCSSGRYFRFVTAAAIVCSSGCTLIGGRSRDFVPQQPRGRAEAILSGMKLEHKVAQMLVVELEGAVLPSDTDRRLIGVHGVGGVIVPRWSSVSQSTDYIDWIRNSAAANRNGVAPFVVLAEPAGLGVRLPRSATTFPRPLALAAGGDIETAREVARLAAREMRAVGVTMVLGPVADVCDRADRPTASLDCFGSGPEQVAEMVAATVDAYQNEGIVPAVAYFPGLGSCDRAPSTGMPIVAKPVSTFAREDLFPFKHAVEDGARALLVSHAVVPAVDSSLVPASMSDFFLNSLLRDAWAYDGLIVADALGQRAVSGRYPPGERSVRAVRAGADMLIWRTGYSRYIATMQALCDAVVDGKVSVKRINESVLRILRTKETYGLLGPEVFMREPDERRLGSKEARTIAETAARRAVTMLKNEGRLLPLDPKSVPRTALVSLIRADTLVSMIEKCGVDVRVTECYSARVTRWNPDSAEIDRAEKLAAESDIVLVTIVPVGGKVPRGQQRLWHRLAGTGVPVVGLVLGMPVNLSKAEAIRAGVAAYSPDEAGLDAAVGCVFGKAALRLVPQQNRQVRVAEVVPMDIRSMAASPPGRVPFEIDGPSSADPSEGYFPIGMDKRVQWDFGDGTKSRGILADHSYALPGTYTVTVTCRDPFGEESHIEFKVEVSG